MPAETLTELLAAMLRDISTQEAFDPNYRPRLANYADRIRDALDGDRVHLTLTEVEYDAVLAEVEREARVVPVLAALLRRHQREVAPPIDPINIDALMRKTIRCPWYLAGGEEGPTPQCKRWDGHRGGHVWDTPITDEEGEG